MDSMPVNWEALDALIIDFVKSENLIEDSSFMSSTSPPSSPSSSSSPSLSSSSYHSRLIVRQIRRSLETGDVDATIDLLRNHGPFILNDHRLLFRLQKQVSLLNVYMSGCRENAGNDFKNTFNCLVSLNIQCLNTRFLSELCFRSD